MRSKKQAANFKRWQQYADAPKRAFVFRFNSPAFIEIIRRLQSESAIRVLYWTASKKYFNELANEKDGFPDTVFHDTLDSVRGIPARDISECSFGPPDKEIVSAMSTYEPRILSIMRHINYSGISFQEKRHLYYTYLGYWNCVFGTLRPDVLFFGDVPHIADQMTAYCLAKVLGVKTIICRIIQINGRMVVFDDIEEYEKIKQEADAARGKTYTAEDIERDLIDFLKKHEDTQGGPTPFYMKSGYIKTRSSSYRLPTPGSILRNIERRSFFTTASSFVKMFFRKRRYADLRGFYHTGFFIKWKNIQWVRARKKLKRELTRFQVSMVDFSEKFVYVPLQFQPECTTSAMGGIYADQLLMVETLSAALPEGWQIYAKENPLQFVTQRGEMARYTGYYERIARLKNTKLVPLETSTFELIKNAQAVAVVTGTPGWEALMRGKPALVFGHIWYMYCSGVFRVSGISSCKDALRRINAGYRPAKQDVLNFLFAIGRATFPGYPNLLFKKGQELSITEEDNIENIKKEFLGELRR